MSISDNTVSEIKSRANIIDVIGRVIPIKKAGNNYKGVCPFHNEKTPSFVVSEQKQIFTCFGCGATGDVIEFVQRYYNLNFSQAIERLASEYGIELKSSDVNSGRRNLLYEINIEAAKFWYKSFHQNSNKGYYYMQERKIELATLKTFGIGYADESWDSLYRFLIQKGYDAKILLELGLISESKGKYYDKFRNRVMFPIINTRGKIIGFGGRAIGNAEPKYLNSPENAIFHKKSNLYALNVTKQDVGKEGYAILVEGYMDVISLWQAGIKNVSASLGTALTENQAQLLSRYTKNVILSYDSDNAGRSAALRGLDILYKEGLNAKVLHVDDGKDPDEFIKKHGKEAFLRLVQDAMPHVDYKIDAAKRKADVYTEGGRVKFFRDVIEILKGLSPVEADIYIKKISRDMKISEGALRAELSGTVRPAAAKPRKEEVKPTAEASMLEKNLLKLIITDMSYYPKIAPYTNIFKDSAAKILAAAKEIHEKGGGMSGIVPFLDYLEDNEIALLREIDQNIPVEGMEEKIFTDCIKEIEIGDLRKREEELNMMLTLTSEEENASQIEEIMKEMTEIQKMIRGLEGLQ